MKNIFRMMALYMLLFSFIACGDDDEETVPTLEVNYASLHGTWKLAEWNGAPLADGTYCYITFVRRDRTFKIYQNFDSMYARSITGTFLIENDRELGYVISGEYDYGRGEWNNKYIVTDLLESGSMIWTVKDDPADVSRYERCDEIPQEVIEETKEK